ncbi:hypothetical protein HPB49_011316 [Dermacentor silvarum]|uniref:Uncharacterized protein n=1 Tax=Dermacentor silvarum TaxID=543639 RepID=A0ACB8C3A5_DERSI|nr:hypothetical protein HPB49_011316 [Dermacentor silvarum]
MAAYKRLLVQIEVTSSSSGYCSEDIVSVLNATATAAMVDARSTLTDMRRESVLQPNDHHYTYRIDWPESLSAFVGSVVPYIAGFIVRKVCATTTCEQCIAAMHSDELAPLINGRTEVDLIQQCDAILTVKSRAKQLILEVLGATAKKKWFHKLE